MTMGIKISKRTRRLSSRREYCHPFLFALCAVFLSVPQLPVQDKGFYVVHVVSAQETKARYKDETANRSDLWSTASDTRAALKNQQRATPSSATRRKLTMDQIVRKAASKGLGGGLPGAIAGAFQVVTLMWLRTIINYQCRYGTTFQNALQTLLNQGGIARLYRGLPFALVQGPLSRFISTAANDGVNAFVTIFPLTASWGPGPTTVVASLVVGMARIMLMPIDTMKTVLQVDSIEGFSSLMRRVKSGRFGVLYAGALATALSACIGHFPWFYTYNILSKSELLMLLLPSELLRNASIGFTASIVSDTVTNSIRVVKTTKQSLESKHAVTYIDTIRLIVQADGWRGLFGRGLSTRIAANAIQSIVFTVIWRGLVARTQRRAGEAEHEAKLVV